MQHQYSDYTTTNQHHHVPATHSNFTVSKMVSWKKNAELQEHSSTIRNTLEKN